MSTERPLPKIRRRREIAIALAFIVICLASLVWSVMVDSMTPFWFVGGSLLLVVLTLYYRRRCPQCGRYMAFRAEPIRGQPGRLRILFDCKDCDTVWDSGEVQDECIG